MTLGSAFLLGGLFGMFAGWMLHDLARRYR